ncbi:MAG TPA: type III polyketide synthase [Planctomycetaceae bacterium]|nr:type III polyketide synthase [Planctomycetaceae bacterium]
MDVVIAGLGTALPRHQIPQTLAAEASIGFCCEEPGQARSVTVLFRMSGVETRRLAILKRSDGTLAERQEFYPARTLAAPSGPTTGERLEVFQRESGSLAVAAATQALERGGVDARRVTHLITVTCSGFSAPGFDYALIDQLPLRPGVARTQVGFMGCHAALNALRVARAFVAADSKSVVLVCCVELCSLHYQYGWDPEQIVANSLFSDGAAACVVQHADSDRSASERPYHILVSGSTVLPDSRDAMTWRIGDHGFRMTLSPGVPSLLAQHLWPWLSEWLGHHGHRPETIGGWAVHPGGPRILQAFAEAMRLAPSHLDPSREVLRQHGNMSSPTLLFILDRLRASQSAGPYLAIGFGPGLAAEATLLQ